VPLATSAAASRAGSRRTPGARAGRGPHGVGHRDHHPRLLFLILARRLRPFPPASLAALARLRKIVRAVRQTLTMKTGMTLLTSGGLVALGTLLGSLLAVLIGVVRDKTRYTHEKVMAREVTPLNDLGRSCLLIFPAWWRWLA
jgi:hypothetical protein